MSSLVKIPVLNQIVVSGKKNPNFDKKKLSSKNRVMRNKAGLFTIRNIAVVACSESLKTFLMSIFCGFRLSSVFTRTYTNMAIFNALIYSL